MQSALQEKRESFRCRIRREKLKPMLDSRRQCIIQELDRKEAAERMEETASTQERLMMLRCLNESLSRQEKDELVARLPFVRGERRTNLFKLLIQQKAVRPELSAVAVEMWSSEQMVQDIARCLRDRMLRLDDHLTIPLILGKMRQCQPKDFSSYLSMVRALLPFLYPVQVAEMITLIDSHLTQTDADDIACARMMNELINRDANHSALIFKMNSMNRLFEKSATNGEMFELCISVLLNCPDEIQDTLQQHPKLIETTSTNMAVNVSLDSRIVAYNGLKGLLCAATEVQPYLHLVEDIHHRYLLEPSGLVKSKIIEIGLVLLNHQDTLARRYFLYRRPLIELVLDSLTVRNSCFVKEAIEIIGRAILRDSELALAFMRYGLLQMLGQIQEEHSGRVAQEAEALRELLEKSNVEVY